MPTAGEVLVDSLTAQRIDRIFCVPGESYLGLLDALYDNRIDTVVCRHEAGAGYMALADARLTGRPGIVCVSRGPGASNAAIAAYAAYQEGVPLILLVGQVAVRDLRQDAFQEFDCGAAFRWLAKWVGEVTDPDRIAAALLRGIRAATAGQPGPVVLSLPEDVLAAASQSPVLPGQVAIRAAPDARDVATVREWLSQASKPLVISGANLESLTGRGLLHSFLERWNLPTIVSFRRQDLFPNAHRLYAGELGFENSAAQMAVLHESDLVLVLGARLTDVTAHSRLFPYPGASQARLVHIHPDCAVIGTHCAADVAIACDACAFIEALGEPLATQRGQEDNWIRRLRAEHLKTVSPHCVDVDDGVPFERVAEVVASGLPRDAIVTLDAGAFAAPVYRLVPFAPPQRLLASVSGAMGFGVPAAVAAGLREPARPVICLVGDGGFLMTGNELAVAHERRLPLKVIVAENRLYGSIRVHQQRRYPGRICGTSFTNPDLELTGRAFGFNVTRIRSCGELRDLPDLLNRPGPEFVIIDTSVKAMAPGVAA
jgi:acetolactate synthase-1/2/3 large subunit